MTCRLSDGPMMASAKTMPLVGSGSVFRTHYPLLIRLEETAVGRGHPVRAKIYLLDPYVADPTCSTTVDYRQCAVVNKSCGGDFRKS
jgi:hypothetical protein